MRRFAGVLVVSSAVLMLAGCAPGAGTNQSSAVFEAAQLETALNDLGDFVSSPLEFRGNYTSDLMQVPELDVGEQCEGPALALGLGATVDEVGMSVRIDSVSLGSYDGEHSVSYSLIARLMDSPESATAVVEVLRSVDACLSELSDTGLPAPELSCGPDFCEGVYSTDAGERGQVIRLRVLPYGNAILRVMQGGEGTDADAAGLDPAELDALVLAVRSALDGAAR